MSGIYSTVSFKMPQTLFVSCMNSQNFEVAQCTKMHCNILQRHMLLVALFSVTPKVTNAQHVAITVGLMFSDIGGRPLHYWHFKPACDIAIATVNEGVRKGHYLNISLSSVLGPTDAFCGIPFIKSSGVASDLYYEHNIKVIFGPPCSDETERVAEIAWRR